MARFIREWIGRELGVDLAVHPVSTVGTDESLLTRWFEQELTPLLDQHRTLVDESLRRKIAHLRESVISALETILARRGGETTKDGAKIDTAEANSLLESADEAIRFARGRTVNWSDDRLEFAASIPLRIANAVLAAPALAPASELAGLVDQAIRRRGMAAYNVVASLQDVLSTTIESLRRASKLADADATSVRDFRRRSADTESRSVAGQLVRNKPLVGGHRPVPRGLVDRAMGPARIRIRDR